jgi:glycosyltransferase involved in cell wall biosynthesis
MTIPVAAHLGNHSRKLASWAEKFLAGSIANAESYTIDSLHRIARVMHELNEGDRLKPFVTIITVEKDDPVGLKRTALSILGQSSSQFEWVVVSSSLKFDSLSLLESLSDDHRVTIVHQTPKGIYPAMNFGAEVACGRYLWFINAGDFLLGPNSVSDVILDLQMDSPGLLLTSVANVTLSGFIYGFTHPKALTFEKNRYMNANHQGSLVSLDEFERVGGFDETYRFAADGNFLDKVLSGGKYRISDLVLVAFTLGGASSTSISTTLAEISRYRPRSGSQALERWILLKTRLRNWMIQSTAAQIFANFYLGKREGREIIACGGASSFILDKHWRHRTQNQKGLLTCCF